VFDLGGRVVGTESIGIYEEMERIDGLAPACQLHSLPFDQVNKFLAIAEELGKNPLHLFYLQAYGLTKRHVAERLATRRAAQERDIFSQFEAGFLRRNLIDIQLLRHSLNQLARQFEERYGDRFRTAMSSLST
jgi:hypothetical protein